MQLEVVNPGVGGLLSVNLPLPRQQTCTTVLLQLFQPLPSPLPPHTSQRSLPFSILTVIPLLSYHPLHTRINYPLRLTVVHAIVCLL